MSCLTCKLHDKLINMQAEKINRQDGVLRHTLELIDLGQADSAKQLLAIELGGRRKKGLVIDVTA